jgi:hypothetical protein
MTRRIRINGQNVEPAQADVVEVEPGVYSVIMGEASFEVRLTGDEISIGEHVFRFDVDDPRKWNRSRKGKGSLLSKP